MCVFISVTVESVCVCVCDVLPGVYQLSGVRNGCSLALWERARSVVGIEKKKCLSEACC